MKAFDTIARYRREFADMPLAGKQALLAFHCGLTLLSDCVDFAQLADGKRLRDAIDFSAWLRELEAAAALAIQTQERTPQERTRVCPRCGHVHKDSKECGMEMGGAGVCKCDVEVMA